MKIPTIDIKTVITKTEDIDQSMINNSYIFFVKYSNDGLL